jgi:erythromycin esterase-like protein
MVKWSGKGIFCRRRSERTPITAALEDSMQSYRPRMIALLTGIVACLGWAWQTQSVTDWIRANAVPLKTVEAGNGFQDMQPLKKMIGDARIVSLGEATHGSREFFQMKHRMMEFLATEMGFTIFTIEANMPEAYRVNDYVVNGTGDPAQLLRGMYFWTWDTEEVLDMIKWMRVFNQSGRGHVEFTGFDMQTPAIAAGIARDFAARYDTGFAATIVAASGLAATATTATASGPSFGVATGTFPRTTAAGKKIKFSGYIKTENVTAGYAGLWWRVDGASRMLALDNMSDRGAKGTTDWKQYVIELSVDSSVRNINFGALMNGDGTAWFDDLTIELDGHPYADTSFADLGFESARPVGFSTGGNGYRVGLDTSVVHGGKKSLRIQKIAAAPTRPAGPDARVVGAQWSDIVAHLENGRAGYRARGASDREISWAVQNARVVLQTMQMRGNLVTRDRSMAENIKWILDQDARAKIVVWAHNGHVATGGFSYETMGTALRKMYGNQMFVFGFAFNQGSFQAIPLGGGALRDFTVPPAKPGTLDAELAAAGIPLFALDLRLAPAWFKERRGSREIGAAYPADNPFAYVNEMVVPDAFDAVLFVERTTAARKNPGR